MIRQRKKSDPLSLVRNLDAFPKIPDELQVGSVFGGTLSVVSRLLIVFLVYKEITWYLNSNLAFKFKPDTTMDAKLKIHIDITVATLCKSIGADILDSTNQNVFSFGILEEDDTWWDLCPTQRSFFTYLQHHNQYLREEYHSLTHLIFKELSNRGDHSVAYNLPERSDKPTKPFDACRIHGSLTLNKVAGNFHIIGGKSLHFPRGHVHISPMFDENRQNFSHRINRLSFGDATSGIVHPLEGDEKVFTESSTIAQYFIDVVPTEVESLMSSIHTFQYSVKENIRPVDHDKGSHGIPGIYIKYDVSALKVHVTQDREHVAKFIVRLCSIIAGIVVISGFVNASVQLYCSYFFGASKYATLNHSTPSIVSVHQQRSSTATTGPVAPTNLLFTPAVSGAGFDSEFTPLVKQ